MDLVTVATCNLNQWALDFRGNLGRIRASIREAKARGAIVRTGPRLEVTGYGCEDHFLELDTLRHAWEALAELLSDDLTDGILCDVGLPVLHRGTRYVARAYVLDRRLLLIRPETALADGGHARESRWFAPWRRECATEPFALPAAITEATGQTTVPIGDAVVAAHDAVLASASAEASAAPHRELGRGGAEILSDGAASPFEAGGAERRLRRLRALGQEVGGVHLFANGRGCDGGRLYYDGGATILVNGEVVAQGSRFAPREVEVVTADVDLDAVRSHRAAEPGRMRRAADAAPFPRVAADLALARPRPGDGPDRPRPPSLHPLEEEIALAPALWLWDYARRSGAGGFFLALSGGSDSAAVATTVGVLCDLLLREARGAGAEVGAEDAPDGRARGDDARHADGLRAELRRVLELGDDEPLPADARGLARRLLTTAFLPSEVSSEASRERARAVAADVGSEHLEVPIEAPVAAFVHAYADAAGAAGEARATKPRFRAHGGDAAEDLALQNLQARTRLVAQYLLAQLTPARQGRRRPRLVLGTSNVDEALRGYVTKYDTSSADVNPIGGLSKGDVRRLLAWARDRMGYASLGAVLEVAPSAELTPADERGPQTDEGDMGLTYAELALLGRLRGVDRCGPLETFERLLAAWDDRPPREVAHKVRLFYGAYAAHRHKATVATPALHAGAYGAADGHGDPRPFLYESDWRWQFDAIERRLERLEGGSRSTATGAG